MPLRRYQQVDVFADRPGAGNPLAVVLDAEGLDDAAMQAIARWTRLPETTFLLPATGDDASYRIRIFSPRREVPFAGHPSVGSAHVALACGLAAPRHGLLVQDGVAGKLPLRVTGTGRERTIAVRTPRARVLEIAGAGDPRLAAALAGLPLGALPPALVEGGRRWWLVELADETRLRAAEPDWAAIARLAHDTDSMGVCVFARSDDPVYYLAVWGLGGVGGGVGGGERDARRLPCFAGGPARPRRLLSHQPGPGGRARRHHRTAGRRRWRGVVRRSRLHGGRRAHRLARLTWRHSGVTSTRTRMRSPGW